MTTGALPKESIVKGAVETLAWEPLREHLDTLSLDDAAVDFLAGQVRRSSSLILRRADDTRESARTSFLQALREYVATKLGDAAGDRIHQQLELLRKIEQGYRGILESLAQAEISKLPLERRLAAYVEYAAHEYSAHLAKHDEAVKAGGELVLPQGVLLVAESGQQYSIDQAISGIVQTLGMTLLMEAYRNDLFDKRGSVKLPTAGFSVTEEERQLAGSNHALAACWMYWERLEERLRFLGGALKEYSASDQPAWMPEKKRQLYEFGPVETEFFDFAANERLNEKLFQTHMELSFETNVEQVAVGIKDPAPMLPEAWVSVAEMHAAVALSDILNYSITEDATTAAGLNVVEWLRGYAVLKQLAEDRRADIGGQIPHVFFAPVDDLIGVLTRSGLSDEAARRFIDGASFARTSKDLFDCPLVKTSDGRLMVLAFALYSANLPRIILSSMATGEQSFARKGKAFETQLASFLREHGIRVEAFKVKRDEEEFEYDAVCLWGRHLFVFECKNYGLSNNHPVQAYYFELARRSSAKQVQRLVRALVDYPDILRERFGVEAGDVVIVPCVVNALPYSRIGKVDDVYFTDASALRRFFRDRYFRINQPLLVDDKVRVLHRVNLRSAWSADKPAPEDLIRQFEHPYQVEFIGAHTEVTPMLLPLGSEDAFVVGEFTRKQMTLESIAKFAGVSVQSVHKNLQDVSSQVRSIKRIVSGAGGETRKEP